MTHEDERLHTTFESARRRPQAGYDATARDGFVEWFSRAAPTAATPVRR